MGTIHRIWICPDGLFDMPPDFYAYAHRWRALNPDYYVQDWSWSELQALAIPFDIQSVVDDLISRSPQGMTESLACQLADVFSYVLLFLFGGVYVNCDIDPVRSISSLHVAPDSCWACWENSEFLVNAAMGGPASHPFWEAVLAELPRRYFSMPGAEMNQATGPHLLTSVYRNYRGGDFVALPRETFNPFMWDNIPAFGKLDTIYSLESLPKNTIGVHHWAHRRTMRSNKVEEGTAWDPSSLP